MRRSSLAIAVLSLTLASFGRARADDAPWSARWISVAGEDPTAFGVYLFRRSFTLAARPTSFRVRVTADNRYQLFVNGQRVGWGPARSDVAHWQFDTIDLAPALREGPNTVAAIVWNFGVYAGWAQMSRQTGLLVQGDTPAEAALVDTDARWRAMRDPAYAPHSPPRTPTNQGESMDARRHPWGWEQPGFDDAAWKPAQVGAHAITPSTADLGAGDGSRAPGWILVPRRIPMMEETPERLARARRAEGVDLPDGFPGRAGVSLRIPARTSARVLLDQAHLTTAFPELSVTGGTGAELRLRYAEALNAPGKRDDKGHRDEIEGKVLGNEREDVWIADGGARALRPLFWRTYRYVELVVRTADAPITIIDLHGTYTGYPFVRRARFDAAIPDVQRIRDTGWRTARLCAHETYMDCPYWEQLQYVGDTRIQALVSMFEAGDARLARNAIAQLDDSRVPEGITYSRFPSHERQFIPPFSLWWIGMLHDFARYQDDAAFVREHLPGVRAVLAFFAARQRDGGSLGPLPWWNFVDWVASWAGGVPPGWNHVPEWVRDKGPPRPAPADARGASALLDLQLLLAYRYAADLESWYGSKRVAEDDGAAAAQLTTTVRALYFDRARGLFADTPAHDAYSQHTNALAVLAGVTTGAEARGMLETTLADGSLARASIYFRYYVGAALGAAGLGDRYVEALGPWREMLARGLTTWSETADPTRSDCHAWGASPNVELLRTVLGVDSAGPGFARVLLRPSLGALDHASGAVPHPRGEIAVDWTRAGGRLTGTVTLPRGVSGDLVWGSRRVPLRAGPNRVDVRR